MTTGLGKVSRGPHLSTLVASSTTREIAQGRLRPGEALASEAMRRHLANAERRVGVRPPAAASPPPVEAAPSRKPAAMRRRPLKETMMDQAG